MKTKKVFSFLNSNKTNIQQSIFLIVILTCLLSVFTKGFPKLNLDFYNQYTSFFVSPNHIDNDTLPPLNGNCLYTPSSFKSNLNKINANLETNVIEQFNTKKVLSNIKCFGRIEGANFNQGELLKNIDKEVNLVVTVLNKEHQYVLIFVTSLLIFKIIYNIFNIERIDSQFSSLSLFLIIINFVLTMTLFTNLKVIFDQNILISTIIFSLLTFFFARRYQYKKAENLVLNFLLSLSLPIFIIIFLHYSLGVKSNYLSSGVFISFFIVFYNLLTKKLNTETVNKFNFLIMVFILISSPVNLLFKDTVTSDSENIKNNFNTSNKTVVHVILDSLHDDIELDTQKITVHNYKNFRTTGVSTRNSLAELFIGDVWVGDENFQDFVTASSTSEKNLINELSAHGVDTYLYTDKLSRYWNNEIYSRFNNSYVTEKAVLDTDYNFSFISLFSNWALFFNLDLLGFYEFNLDTTLEDISLISLYNLDLALDDYRTLLQKNNYSDSYFFIHLLIPHSPWNLDNECNYKERQYSNPDSSYRCAEKLIDFILTNFDDKNTLIVIHGDTGNTWDLNPTEKNDRNIRLNEATKSSLIIKYPENRFTNQDQDLVYFTTDIKFVVKDYFMTNENIGLSNIQMFTNFITTEPNPTLDKNYEILEIEYMFEK